jgi:hypothetical protein
MELVEGGSHSLSSLVRDGDGRLAVRACDVAVPHDRYKLLVGHQLERIKDSHFGTIMEVRRAPPALLLLLLL